MKNILHLCADLGSDSRYYQLSSDYNVILVGKEIGVENYTPDCQIHGVIANPVCTEFSRVGGFQLGKNPDLSMLVHCLRIIALAKPVWWVIENPANGTMKNYLGKPTMTYQPWEFGSPWTKKTALWGNFQKPVPIYKNWSDVEKNDKLYIRPNRKKPSLAYLHKSAIHDIPEFKFAIDVVKTDADFRSLCSQGFASEFYKRNP